MKRLMVALVAAACAAASYAETQWLDWFKLDKTNAESATWVGDGDVTVEGDKFIVDTDTSTGLTHTPTAVTVSEKGRRFTFEFSAETPFDLSKLTIPADTKGGVSIAKNASETLAFFVIGSESGTLKWQEFAAAGTPTLDTDYTAAVTVDGTTVTYAIGGQTMDCTLPSSETAPAAFTVLGTGSFTEIDGKQAQEVVASIGTTYYATFADAYAAAANGDTIKLLENVESAVAPVQKTVKIDENGKTFTLSKSVDENKVLRCVYANGQIVTQLDFDKDANDAYQIANENDLKKLQKAVAAGTAGANVFKQTADINMSEAGAFDGIGTYDVDGDSTAAFKGVYDGGNHVISNLTLKQGNYLGLFTQVEGGTIQNLIVDTVTFDISDRTTGEWGGAMVIGNLFDGMVSNVTTRGTFDQETGSARHNAAGIVVRMNVGTVIDCTNNAAIYGSYTKMAGIVALVQDKTISPVKPAIIKNCSNTGAITQTSDYKNDKNGGFGGIVGDVTAANRQIMIENCSNTGTISIKLEGGRVGQILAYANNGTTTIKGGRVELTKGFAVGSTENEDKLVNGHFADADGNLVDDATVNAGGTYKIVVQTPPAIALAAGKTLELDKTATVNSADNAYWIDDSAAPTYVSTAKTDYSTAAIEAFAEATWSETLDFPTVVVKADGETVPAEAYIFAWSPAVIASMKVGDPDATYTCTVTIKDTGKVILPAANPTADWTVKAPAAPAGVTITVVRGTGIVDIQKDNVSIFEDAETEKTLVLETGATSVSLTLVADGSIAIPVYKMSKAEIGAGPASKSGSYDIADGDKLTFTALEADVGGVTDAEAQAAIKEVVTSDAAKAKVDAVVEAGVNAKTLATWVGKQDDKTAALEGDYVKASVELDVAPITEGTEVKLVDVDMADVSAMTFKVAVGTDDVSAKEAVLRMVKAGTDVEFKTTFNPSATIVGEGAKKTVQVDISGKDAAFLKVEIPADAK